MPNLFEIDSVVQEKKPVKFTINERRRWTKQIAIGHLCDLCDIKGLFGIKQRRRGVALIQ